MGAPKIPAPCSLCCGAAGPVPARICTSLSDAPDHNHRPEPARRPDRRARAGAAGLPAVPRMARAQAYPTKPVRLIIGFPPGSASDILARIISQWLTERIGQPVIVEAKPGASGNISVQTALAAPADGYTIVQIAASSAVNATLFESLPFDLLRDLTPVAGLASFPFAMNVNPALPAKTVAEFIALAKANPGKISMASFGSGSTSHLAGELFKTMRGINMIHVPYRGSPPANLDLMSGQVQVMFDTLVSSLPASVDYETSASAMI
jgi:tripartite-type tricarboxylate transporter receptor subunit TctC